LDINKVVFFTTLDALSDTLPTAEHHEVL